MQDTKYIDTIFNSSNYVISQIIGNGVQKGDLHQDVNNFKTDDISVMIGIQGNLNGYVIFSMNQTLASRIAEMIIGQEIEDLFDEIGRSCLSELGNMIMGHTSGVLSTQGIITDITPPAIITGDNVSIRNSSLNMNHCLPVLFDDGHVLRINTALKKDIA